MEYCPNNNDVIRAFHKTFQLIIWSGSSIKKSTYFDCNLVESNFYWSHYDKYDDIIFVAIL